MKALFVKELPEEIQDLVEEVSGKSLSEIRNLRLSSEDVFNWQGSPQGHAFWNNIYDRHYNIYYNTYPHHLLKYAKKKFPKGKLFFPLSLRSDQSFDIKFSTGEYTLDDTGIKTNEGDYLFLLKSREWATEVDSEDYYMRIKIRRKENKSQIYLIKENKITSEGATLSYTHIRNSNFCSGRWKVNMYSFHFLQENFEYLDGSPIVGYPTTKEQKILLAEAIRSFPIGTKYFPVNLKGEIADNCRYVSEITPQVFHTSLPKNFCIHAGKGLGLIFANGHWAKIIDLPEKTDKNPYEPQETVKVHSAKGIDKTFSTKEAINSLKNWRDKEYHWYQQQRSDWKKSLAISMENSLSQRDPDWSSSPNSEYIKKEEATEKQEDLAFTKSKNITFDNSEEDEFIII